MNRHFLLIHWRVFHWLLSGHRGHYSSVLSDYVTRNRRNVLRVDHVRRCLLDRNLVFREMKYKCPSQRMKTRSDEINLLLKARKYQHLNVIGFQTVCLPVFLSFFFYCFVCRIFKSIRSNPKLCRQYISVKCPASSETSKSHEYVDWINIDKPSTLFTFPLSSFSLQIYKSIGSIAFPEATFKLFQPNRAPPYP